MLNTRIPGGIHYGVLLKNVVGPIDKLYTSGVVIKKEYYPFDKYQVNVQDISIMGNYIFFVTFYENTWWIYDFIQI